MVLGGISLLLLPIIVGPAAIICGGLAIRRNEPLGRAGLVVGIVGTLAGMILGVVVAEATLHS